MAVANRSFSAVLSKKESRMMKKKGGKAESSEKIAAAELALAPAKAMPPPTLKAMKKEGKQDESSEKISEQVLPMAEAAAPLTPKAVAPLTPKATAPLQPTLSYAQVAVTKKPVPKGPVAKPALVATPPKDTNKSPSKAPAATPPKYKLKCLKGPAIPSLKPTTNKPTTKPPLTFAEIFDVDTAEEELSLAQNPRHADHKAYLEYQKAGSEHQALQKRLGRADTGAGYASATLPLNLRPEQRAKVAAMDAAKDNGRGVGSGSGSWKRERGRGVWGRGTSGSTGSMG